jgi:hypothetical protein
VLRTRYRPNRVNKNKTVGSVEEASSTVIPTSHMASFLAFSIDTSTSLADGDDNWLPIGWLRWLILKCIL